MGSRVEGLGPAHGVNAIAISKVVAGVQRVSLLVQGVGLVFEGPHVGCGGSKFRALRD